MTTREMAIPQAGLHIAEQPASPRGVPGWVVWGAGTLVFLGVVIGIVVLAR
jgi:hypothetical protein